MEDAGKGLDNGVEPLCGPLCVALPAIALPKKLAKGLGEGPELVLGVVAEGAVVGAFSRPPSTIPSSTASATSLGVSTGVAVPSVSIGVSCC